MATSAAQTPLEQSRPSLEGARWSTAVRCPRAAVYEAQDAPRREWTVEEQRFFRRGAAWGKLIADDVCAELRDQGRRPRREVEVPWPAADPVGVGHADIYIPHQREIVECFSTADGGVQAQKTLQAAGYCLNHPRAESASLISVDTHTGEDHVYPINVEALRPRVEEIQAAVVSGIRGGELPARTCQTPIDGARCPFRDHCFADWEWPPIDELLGGRDLLRQLADESDLLGEIRDQERSQKAVVEQTRDRVARLALPDPETPGRVEVAADGVSVTISTSIGESFSLADARKAGHDLGSPASILSAFTRPKLTRRWTVRRSADH